MSSTGAVIIRFAPTNLLRPRAVSAGSAGTAGFVAYRLAAAQEEAPEGCTGGCPRSRPTEGRRDEVCIV